MILIGSHSPFTSPNYLKKVGDFAYETGANAAMVYLGAPQNTRRVDVNKFQLSEFEKSYPDFNKDHIIVHAPYIVNPANPEKFQFAIDFLIQETERMNFLGLKYMVLHPGSSTTFDRKHSIEVLIKSLKSILNQSEKVVILLETMAGKGQEIGKTFEELQHILNEISSDRLGVCLDTCHIWEAGYDIHDWDGVKKHLKECELFERIKVIHLNDSKNPRGASKDRHENIGKGFIGLKTLKEIVHDPEFANVPKILETPWVDGVPLYKEEIQLLK